MTTTGATDRPACQDQYRVPRTRAVRTTPCTGRTSRCPANLTWFSSPKSGTWTPSTRDNWIRWTRGRPFTCPGRRRSDGSPSSRRYPLRWLDPRQGRQSPLKNRFYRPNSKTCFRKKFFFNFSILRLYVFVKGRNFIPNMIAGSSGGTKYK